MDALNADPTDTLSYLVMGWYSDPQDDPLAKIDPGCDFNCILDKLRWSPPEGTDKTLTASWCVLAGMVNGVQWQTASIPKGGAPSGAPVSIAVGNTSVEALTALITRQAEAQQTPIDPDLLEAFQLDLIDVLDEPDGGAVLANAIHTSTFQKFSGGYVWEIVDAPGANSQVDAQELEKEQQWLAALNIAQQKLDAANRLLVSLQRALYFMWWKDVSWGWQFQGSTPIQGLNNQDLLDQQLDPNQGPSPDLPNGSVAWQVAQQKQTVATLAANVPNGSTPEALQAAMDAYAATQGLPASLRV